MAVPSGASGKPATGPSSSEVLDAFEPLLRNFIVERLSSVEGWEGACLPGDVRRAAEQRHQHEKKMNDVLNKPDHSMFDYVNFDAYERIITRRDNWRNHFEPVFRRKDVFSYKMEIIRSVRNDARHARDLDYVNRLRLRLHCYDIISQIYESQRPNFRRASLKRKFGLAPA